ncbi:hypothetical protein ACFQY5_08555 [Paeniroseomonas aquatica]|uniref:Uncharacterized protein n=1 Tax=Paeniroseomonas aquatica TaxID=373043 RepID=A0ABT8A4P1_9PROT|nr:hypothetical protein [Paeniroseomonas aquatica]MDN3564757.1 hypothetical protein [Paeniroseomonas aquatica]
MSRPAVLLAALLLAGCSGPPSSIALPGGPSRGTMTHEEAMGARSGLTRLDRLPLDAAPPRGSMRRD